MKEMNTLEQLTLKYGAMMTLDEIAPYFNCKKSKEFISLYDRGQCPIPVTTLKKPNAKRYSKCVMTKHLAPYLDDMAAAAELEYKNDQKALQSR